VFIADSDKQVKNTIRKDEQNQSEEESIHYGSKQRCKHRDPAHITKEKKLLEVH
jgi:hypothetical protein